MIHRVTLCSYDKKMATTRTMRKTIVFVVPILCSFTCGMYWFITDRDKLHTGFFYHKTWGSPRPYTAVITDIKRNIEVQKDRLAQVHQTCAKYRKLMTAPGYSDHGAVFNVAPKYNWSYCKIGKIGSTLWTQFFYILHHEGKTVNDVLTKPREDIHNVEGLDHTILGVNNSQCNSTRMILSARNPYTRLFSAYIDRMYIPSTSISVRGEDDPKCKSEISFPEFLQSVVSNTRHGHFDYHWSPVFYLCKPCEINPAFVTKQETFNDDFYFTINQTNLEPYKLDVLLKAISAEANWAGFSLVDDVLDYITPRNVRRASDCQTLDQVTRRLWEALIISGFISEKAPFPYSRYKTLKDYKNSNILRAALKEARASYPLTKTDKSLQRRSALNRFYKSVDAKIIEEIKEVYRVDFDMFGYSYDPPPW